ncbi:AMP-binding protein [Gordonia sp. N1V]|uniref:AMP-binding protein n=1 Tax=Gordonia sp. N1V TaxID=3034163 RepID=UPI0023E209CA|nr:AMP-binding protein [Gordonia sp. N1V]MDF3284231.1 AMP-binding protein [Gordonia sp. N1V]
MTPSLAGLRRIAIELRATGRLARAGILPGPTELPATLRAARAGGGATLTEVLAARFGDSVAVVDRGVPLTYRDLAIATRRWITVLRELDTTGDRPTVGIMCRNSAQLVIALLGALAGGVRVVFLNTDMGSAQLTTVCEREHIDLLLHDDEFTGRLSQLTGVRTIRTEDLESVLAAADDSIPPRAHGNPELVILTSGTSGVPRGAARSSSPLTMLSTLAGLLEKIPLRRSDVIYLAPPAFHGWGLIATLTGLLAGATLVFDGRFSAERAVATMLTENCTAFVAVPTMLKRIMDLDDAVLQPLSGRLRIIGSGGARLDPDLVTAVTERFGPVLHNLYGATEVSYITIATPADLAHDPSCAGSAPLGVRVAILIDGMVATGDTGYLDGAGRLYVRGRSDSMIVSGGENVYPEEVELALHRHPGVADASVFTVDDADFGQRLSAVVARRAGHDVDDATLKEHIGQELSRSRVPRDIVFVDEIARTATGKVTRAWLDEVTAGTSHVG